MKQIAFVMIFSTVAGSNLNTPKEYLSIPKASDVSDDVHTLCVFGIVSKKQLPDSTTYSICLCFLLRVLCLAFKPWLCSELEFAYGVR